MSARPGVCAQRPAFAAPPRTATPAFNIRALFDRKFALELVEKHFDKLSDKVEETSGIPKSVSIQLYALAKQALEGDAPKSAPLFGNRKKWREWADKSGMDKMAAMQKYILLAKQYVDGLDAKKN